jgi:outer membrane protein assembly factor BamB
MRCSRNKIKLTSTIVIVLLMASVALMAMPVQPVKAQLSATQPVSGPLPAGVTVNATVPAKAYLSFRPNPVGLGQPILVNIWTMPAPVAGRMQLDYKVTITKPDETKDVLVMNSYPDDGTQWFEYVVDQVGTWKLKFEFPGTYFPAGRYSKGYIVTNTTGSLYTESAYYEPSSTAEQTLTVQEEIVESWPPEALPTDYWTRPVAYEHREWWPILGNYPWYGPGGGTEWDALYPDTNPYWGNYFFTPWVQGPNTAHVAWKRQGAIAGILGGDWGVEVANLGFFSGSIGFNPTIVYAGRAYQTLVKDVNGEVKTVWQSYDIRTGEVYWEHVTEIASVGFGPYPTTYYAPSYIEYSKGQHPSGGGDPNRVIDVNLLYIGNGRLIKWNPFTGAVSANVSISPLTTGTYYMNAYVLSVQNIGTTTNPNYRLINWTTLGTTSNFASRVVSNITWPWSSLGTTVDYNVGIAASASSISRGGSYVAMNAMAASLTTGQLLWNITREGETVYSGSAVIADHGKVAILTEQGYFLALNLNSGQVAWKSEALAYPWDEPGFGAYAVESVYGLLYHEAYTGIYAFDWKTGKIAWKFEAPAAYPYETPYVDENGTTVYSWNTGALIADGKLYAYNTEHSATVPITRGWKLHCINATTGELIWSVMLPGASSKHATDIGAIADGYMTIFSSDGYMYVYGKGKSATTVTASPKTIANGAAVLIEGTVLDQSPAQPGTPCVSKESMATYMEYLHKQLPIDGIYHNVTVTGVPVRLLAIDSNGTVIDIGTATSDVSGTFGYAWTPPKEDIYKITATFAGDDSYGSSWAETHVSVGPAPASPTPTPEQPQAAPDSIPYIIGIGIAIILAVAVATILILKKRP